MSDKLTIFHNDGTTTEVEPIKPWSPCTCCPKCQEKLKMIPKLILQNGRLAEEKYSLQAENQRLAEQIEQLSACIDSVLVVAADYDGYTTVEGFKKLVYRLASIASSRRPEEIQKGYDNEI